MSNPTICSCGHPPTPQKPGACGIGYGSLFIREEADGSKVYETRCYDCCAAYTRERMSSVGKADLYLVRKKSADGKEFDIFTRHVTDWTGHLEFRCIETRHYPRAGGFGSQRTDAWFAFEGYIWHAVNRGDNQMARCKRTKKRA